MLSRGGGRRRAGTPAGADAVCGALVAGAAVPGACVQDRSSGVIAARAMRIERREESVILFERERVGERM
jgi:hypothetical protein